MDPGIFARIGFHSHGSGMKIRCFLLILLLLLPAEAAFGALQVRPFTGNGVLIVRNFNPDDASSVPVLTLYREPGVGRIAELPISSIPLLSSLVTLPAGDFPLAVMGKKGEWMLVSYDDAGREGWVKMARWWEYVRWEDFLGGRTILLLSGLKREKYFMHARPEQSSPQTAELLAGGIVKVLEVSDDWVHATTATGVSGWFCWRDGDGRFLIKAEGRNNPQKH
jgi:hypothetical protein